jgi:hypothetical protein
LTRWSPAFSKNPAKLVSCANACFPRLIGDQDGVVKCACQRFNAGSEVHAVADGRIGKAALRAHVTDKSLAAVDAYANGKRLGPSGWLPL